MQKRSVTGRLSGFVSYLHRRKLTTRLKNQKNYEIRGPGPNCFIHDTCPFKDYQVSSSSGIKYNFMFGRSVRKFWMTLWTDQQTCCLYSVLKNTSDIYWLNPVEV